MVARLAGASLGLPPFATTSVAGRCVGTPPTFTPLSHHSRHFMCCIIGLLLGPAAHAVVSGHEHNRVVEAPDM